MHNTLTKMFVLNISCVHYFRTWLTHFINNSENSRCNIMRNVYGHVVIAVDQSHALCIFHSAFYFPHSAFPHFINTRFQGITQFYLPPKRLSTSGMNHTRICIHNQSRSSFTDPRGMEGWVGLGTTSVSSLPRIAKWRKSQLLAAKTIMPHRATGNAAGHERQTHDLLCHKPRC